jgi:hypothetical protein
MSSTGAKGSQQTNKKTKKWFKQREQKTTEVLLGLAHRTGLSGVPPNSVRCTREFQLRTAHLREFWEPLRYNSPDCPVCQRSNGYYIANGHLPEQLMHYSARRSQSKARRRTRQSIGPVRCTTGLSSGPDVRSSNGQNPTAGWRGWRTRQCPVAHRTVRCAMRQQPSPNG